MTPKEKAKELFEKFEYQDNFGIEINIGIKGIDYNTAKKCALIAVDEMINVYATALFSIGGFTKEEAEIYNSKYLEEVKQEIEKL